MSVWSSTLGIYSNKKGCTICTFPGIERKLLCEGSSGSGVEFANTPKQLSTQWKTWKVTVFKPVLM